MTDDIKTWLRKEADDWEPDDPEWTSSVGAKLREAADRIEELEVEIAKRDALAEDAHEYVLAQINQGLKQRIEGLQADLAEACRLIRENQARFDSRVKIARAAERERCRDVPCEACGIMDNTIVPVHLRMIAALCFACRAIADGRDKHGDRFEIWARVAQKMMRDRAAKRKRER